MVTNRLAEILARMVQEAIEHDQRWIRWAIETDETPVEPCACRIVIGEQGCICNVELAVPRAYMIRAKRRLEQRQFVGMPPHKRRCLLCHRGEHDLDITSDVRICAPDGSVINRLRIPVRVRRSKREARERAERASAFPAGTHEAQIAAARDYEAQRLVAKR
jgi:hypothetical protein